jgi:transcriptional regulator with XRE-family HTH domain
MDSSNDVTEFLSSRRGRITPEQAGLPSYGARRVPGLRREEVASLAGVSVEYYKRLERGNLSGVSELVLKGLANALALDDAEREHLFDLARAAGPVTPRRRRASFRGVRPNVQRILDALDTPAVARAPYGNYVAANALGRALYAPLFNSPEQPANSARFTFLDPAAIEFYLDWDRIASDLVAHLRSEAGGKSYDRALTDLVGELSTRSEPFRKLWAAHNVRFHRTGTKRIRHPIVGEMELSFESMALSADAGLAINVYTAEPGSRSEETLRLLSSWTATPAEPPAPADADLPRP